MSYVKGKKFSVALLIILFDQLTKYCTLQALPFQQAVVLTSFLNLYHSVNHGAAFSFLSEHPLVARWLFSGIALLVSGAVTFYMTTLAASQRLLQFSLALILGGAIGNLIDRLRLGHVIDFIQLHAGNYYWPVFNVADTAICIGAVLILIDSMKSEEKKNENITG